MSIEKVREYLKEFGKDKDVLEFDVSSATVELAAKALSLTPGHIAKTLSFEGKDGECILIVAAGDEKIDNRKFKDKFGFKAKMLSHDQALALTGHAVGGVCPFALPEGVKVYLDESLKRFEFVYPAAGSSNSAVKMTPDELYTASRALEWVDVCKLPEA